MTEQAVQELVVFWLLSFLLSHVAERVTVQFIGLISHICHTLNPLKTLYQLPLFTF